MYSGCKWINPLKAIFRPIKKEIQASKKKAQAEKLLHSEKGRDNLEELDATAIIPLVNTTIQNMQGIICLLAQVRGNVIQFSNIIISVSKLHHQGVPATTLQVVYFTRMRHGKNRNHHTGLQLLRWGETANDVLSHKKFWKCCTLYTIQYTLRNTITRISIAQFTVLLWI